MVLVLIGQRWIRSIMHYQMHSAACAAILLSCLATAAQAATVTVTQGEVMLSRGDGYEAVRGKAEVLAGDSIVAKPGGAAKVSFSNGCSVFLAMGMVYSVPPEPPCGVQNASTMVSSPATPGNWASGTQTVAAGDQSPNLAAGTQTLPAGDASTGVQVAAADPAGTNIMPYLLGAAAIGGVAVAVGALGGGGGGSPASP